MYSESEEEVNATAHLLAGWTIHYEPCIVSPPGLDFVRMPQGVSSVSLSLYHKNPPWRTVPIPMQRSPHAFRDILPMMDPDTLTSTIEIKHSTIASELFGSKHGR